VELLLLPLTLFSAYEDVRKRVINTIPYLAVDIALLCIFLYFKSIVSLLVIPIILEYFMKKYSYIPYFIVAIPLIFSPSVLTVSLGYSISLVKVFSLLVKNFGSGDVKVLQTIAISFPLYPNLPLPYSLFPPVLSVLFIASISGIISSLINSRPGTGKEVVDEKKYWVIDGMRKYKIPFVAHIFAGYTIILILSLLRLV